MSINDHFYDNKLTLQCKHLFKNDSLGLTSIKSTRSFNITNDVISPGYDDIRETKKNNLFQV